MKIESFSEFTVNEVRDRNDIRLWNNMWKSIWSLSPQQAREIISEFNITDELMEHPEKMDQNIKVQIISVLTDYLQAFSKNSDSYQGIVF